MIGGMSAPFDSSKGFPLASFQEYAISGWNLNRSTEETHRSKGGTLYGKYKDIRRRNLDSNYHATYSRERVLFQDAIVDSMLEENTTTRAAAGDYRNCSQPERPWIVFTAGAMGAGKSHTIKLLHEKERFPLQSFTVVDPDRIRRRLPEFVQYVKLNPERAGELTRKESGLIAEVLIQAALERGHNVLVDGSLRDAVWYRNYFQVLRHKHPAIRIAILHVTAPRRSVFEHASRRAKITGRVVPRDLLESSIEQVPKSVALLRPMVDFSVDINNSGTEDVELVTPGVDWEIFQNQWVQTSCVLK